MPTPQPTSLTDRQRQAFAHGKTVRWVVDAFQIPRPRLVALIAAEGWVIDPATDKVRVRLSAPTGIHTTEPKAEPMASDTATVLEALRDGIPVPQVADKHSWSESSLRALVNGQKDWALDPNDDTVRTANGTDLAPVDPEPTTEPPAAPTPTPAETLAGGVEQLLADARGCGDKRIERAATKADTAIAALVALYEPWLDEQKAEKERAAKLAAANDRAAKLRAQLAEAQADVATLKGKPTRRTSAAKSTSTAARARSQVIRAWATENGIKVNERGKIPAHIVEQYDAAHAGGGDG